MVMAAVTTKLRLPRIEDASVSINQIIFISRDLRSPELVISGAVTRYVAGYHVCWTLMTYPARIVF